jgi:hypothetical protein
MMTALAYGAFAGHPSGASGNRRSPSNTGNGGARTNGVGGGHVPDFQRTWSEPVVGA